ncbi:MAG: hypothetical protein WA913_00525 [Pricia sp.]
MKTLTLITTLCLLSYSFQGLAQVKNEREYRIERNQFPEKSIRSLSGYLDAAKRIRYFKEYDGEKTSFEVKFKLNRKKHSVEFDSIGNLEDVETYIDKEDIPRPAVRDIEKYLESEFTRYRIVKIQRQYPKSHYKEDADLLENAFQNTIDTNVNYEIVVAGRKKDGFEDYEMTFDSIGGFLNSRKFISIGYDHILY